MVDGKIKVNVIGDIEEAEVQAYIEHVKKNNSDNNIDELEIKLDGDYVELKYKVSPVSFERIRRITGYLVGTTARWNNAKRAEEKDRIKHG